MSGENTAQIKLYQRGSQEPIAESEFEALSSTQIMSEGKDILVHTRLADFAHVYWRGRRLTITHDTNVMGAHSGI